MFKSHFVLCTVWAFLAVVSSVSAANGHATIGSAKTFSCDDSESTLNNKGVSTVSEGKSSIYIGYRQLGNNKDPIVARFDDGVQVWCRTDYETTPDDNTGYGLFWDETADRLYGVFSATGTQGSSNEDFRRFATNGWLTHYTDGSPSGGGGAKVAIIAQIDPANGDIDQATFVTAVTSKRKTNSLTITELDFEDGYLKVTANSWYSPRNLDKSSMSCSGSSPFEYKLGLKADLSAAISTSAEGCEGNSNNPPSEVTVSPAIGFVGSNRFVATVGPESVELPITFTWKINGEIVRAESINSRESQLIYDWANAAEDQTLEVIVKNSKSNEFALPAVSSQTYAFNVVEAKTAYLPLVIR